MNSDLAGLPRVHVRSVEHRADEVVVKAKVEGACYDPDGPQWFWLWPSEDRAITPAILEGRPEGDELVLSIDPQDMTSAVAPGAALAWFSPYWQAYHVYMIRRGKWDRRRFLAEDAAIFILGRLRGRNKAHLPIPEGAIAKGIEPGGWDHEHCEICRATIGSGGEPFGYVDPDDHWLCESCHARWAQPRDFGFLLP